MNKKAPGYDLFRTLMRNKVPRRRRGFLFSRVLANRLSLVNLTIDKSSSNGNIYSMEPKTETNRSLELPSIQRILELKDGSTTAIYTKYQDGIITRDINFPTQEDVVDPIAPHGMRTNQNIAHRADNHAGIKAGLEKEKATAGTQYPEKKLLELLQEYVSSRGGHALSFPFENHPMRAHLEQLYRQTLIHQLDQALQPII